MNPDAYQARIYLAQVRTFVARGHMGFAHTLLQWAANRRRAIQAQPKQGELL